MVLLGADAGGCELVVSYTELGGFVGRSQHRPCLCDCCWGSCSTHQQGWDGAGWAVACAVHVCPAMDRDGPAVAAWMSAPSHAPTAAAQQDTTTHQPAGFFWCFRVSSHSLLAQAHDAGGLPSPQRLLPPCAALLAVYDNHLRCLQPHLPHFCHGQP